MDRKTYIAQDELAIYREENAPISCPLLGQTQFTPVVDHDHYTGRIRGVVSLEGNALLGKIENFFRTRCVHAEKDLPAVLRRMADYLEFPQGPFHPVGVRQLTKRFSRAPVTTQKELLQQLNVDPVAVDECKNTKQRVKIYRKLLISRKGEDD